ncbi:PKD repeat-containing protein [Mariniphaga anaerophila]|uniref:PKD repeat-containing protein n=1 Tax=Mariniphaga anaerophila TaxID=1484053 RepID=A0A1M4U0Q3_9BACT|nr:PKD domain-containing protein [Mariniphaga anaerophila]SHE50270.1 PKD repeat-containing protein [Mariniphaga anaerophila]
MKTKFNITILLTILVLGLIISCQDELEELPLRVEFNSESQNVVAGQSVVFTDISEGDPSRWSWKFEGGTPSTSALSSPEIMYSTPGTYPVQLTIGKRNDSVSIVKDAFITVEYGPVSADFTESATSITQGESVSFTDLSQGLPTSWLWEFIPVEGGNTLTSNEQNPTITFNDFGIYTVRLTVSNPKGDDVTEKEELLNVIDITSIEADFTTEFKSTYGGGSIQFNDATLGTVNSWTWTFEGGTPASSTEKNPVVSYSSPGRYKVKLEASNDFKSSEKEVVDYVLVVPGNGLVALYPFDGNWNDAGPNNVDPTNEESGSISFDNMDRKELNGAALFDGESALVVPDHPAFNFGTEDFSISCWIKTDITSKMMIWQESGANGGGDNQTWLRIGDNTTSRKMRFAVEDDTGGAIINSDHGVSDNEWHHVVCTRSGTITNIFVDGEVIATKDTGVIKNVSNNQNFKIGAQETGGGGSYSNKYTGLIDEFILYDRVLPVDEIKALYGL